jgi:histidinol-phosphate aminotransferase
LAALRLHPTWTVHPSRANFFLVRTPDAEVAWKGLLAAGVLVRRQDHLPGLKGCLRVSVGTPAENDAFLRAALALR